MKEKLLHLLYDNRLIRNDEEFEIFDSTLDLLCNETIEANNIISLIHVLDDNTEDMEVMYRLIHLIEEYISSEESYIMLLNGISDIVNNSPEWSRVIMYRLLNDDDSVVKLKKIVKSLDDNVYNNIYKLLINIYNEDTSLFGDKIKEIFFRWFKKDLSELTAFENSHEVLIDFWYVGVIYY